MAWASGRTRRCLGLRDESRGGSRGRCWGRIGRSMPRGGSPCCSLSCPESVGLVEAPGTRTLASAQEGVRRIFARSRPADFWWAGASVRRHLARRHWVCRRLAKRCPARRRGCAKPTTRCAGATHQPISGRVAVRCAAASAALRWDDDVAFPGRIRPWPGAGDRQAAVQLAAADEIPGHRGRSGPLSMRTAPMRWAVASSPGTSLASPVRPGARPRGPALRLRAQVPQLGPLHRPDV